MELYDIGIAEYKDKYKISKCGEVWSMRANKFLKKILNRGNDYHVVHLCQKKQYIHRLVAQTFLDNVNNDYSVDHIDQNIHNNHVHNLRWASRYEQCMNKKCSTPIIWTSVKNGKTTFFWEKVYHKKKYAINSIDLAKVEKFKEETMEALFAIEGEKIPSPDKQATYYGTRPDKEDVVSEDEK